MRGNVGARNGGVSGYRPRSPVAGFSNSDMLGFMGLGDGSGADARSPNRTGLPDALKARFENLSGLPLDDVRVHRNSDKPAGLSALAYAKGSEIHLGPGQEKHLEHELGHVVQQKQGLVPNTSYFKGNPINDNPLMEQQADDVFRMRSELSLSPRTMSPVIQCCKEVTQPPAKRAHRSSELLSPEASEETESSPAEPPKEPKDMTIRERIKRARIRSKMRLQKKTHRRRGELLSQHRGQDTVAPTPFGDARMYTHSRGPVAHIAGKRPTSYSDLCERIDGWIGENPESKDQLIDLMAGSMKSEEESKMPEIPEGLGPVDEDTQKALREFFALLSYAETHERRANPDGGKLARAALRRSAKSSTFTDVFVRSADSMFPQAKTGGNKRMRAEMEEGDPDYLSQMEDYMSASSDDEE